jgi:F0F1-type ATP synthase assembly protein I
MIFRRTAASAVLQAPPGLWYARARMQAAQRPTLDPAGAGGILLAFLALGAGLGALLGWAAGSVGIGVLVGVIVGIPAGVFAVYRRYRGVFS